MVNILKGIMQLAMLAPYNNLASSVAAALVPTLLNSNIKTVEETEPATFVIEPEKNCQGNKYIQEYTNVCWIIKMT